MFFSSKTFFCAPSSSDDTTFTARDASSTCTVDTRFDFPGAAATFPRAITNRGDLAGTFVDPDGTAWSMVTFGGYPYRLYGGVFSSDDKGRVFGYAYDPATARYSAMVGTLPVAENRH